MQPVETKIALDKVEWARKNLFKAIAIGKRERNQILLGQEAGKFLRARVGEERS